MAYVLVHRGATVAVALVLFPPIVWVVSRPLGGLGLGLAMMLMLPSWHTFGTAQLGVVRVAALAAAASAFVAGGWRPRLADSALVVLVLVVVAGALLQYPQPGVGRLTINEFTPIGFYIGARAVSRSRLPSVMFIVLLAGTVGAVTVLYEYWRGYAIFVSPIQYQWNASAGTGLFRPGGIFGGPPSASTVLCVVILLGLGCLPTLRGKKKALAIGCLAVCAMALISTFTRAPLIATGVGILVMLWLTRSPLIRPTRVVTAALAVGVAIALALPALEHNSTFQNGVFRAGTLSERESYWQTAFPIITASAHNVLVGVGTGALETPVSNLVALPSDVATTPQIFTVSLHSEYVTTLVEQGLIGLGALGLFLALAFIPVARVARARADPAARPLRQASSLLES